MCRVVGILDVAQSYYHERMVDVDADEQHVRVESGTFSVIQPYHLPQHCAVAGASRSCSAEATEAVLYASPWRSFAELAIAIRTYIEFGEQQIG